MNDKLQLENKPLLDYRTEIKTIVMEKKTSTLNDWIKGNTVFDRYDIRDEFAGGMGKVFRVFDREWNREMAVKIPHPRFMTKADVMKSFEEECLTWINLGLHPNIVPCYYIKTIDGNFCIFSEFVTGGSLLDQIRSKQLYQESYVGEKIVRIIDIAIQIARGLEHAHQHKVIHCDVKPANIMISTDCSAMITDFGLAKACHVKSAGVSTTQNASESIYSSTGGLTPAYCSPEQLHADVITRRTDVWSWAVTILEMLAGSVFWPDGRYAAEALSLLASRQINNLPVDMALIPEKLLILLAYCFRDKEAGRPKDFEVIGKGLEDIYAEFTGQKYPYQKPKAIDFDAPSLNNKAVSLIELEKSSTKRKSDVSAFTVFNKLQEFYHDYATGTFNNLVYQWRNFSLSVDELNRRLDNLYLPASNQNLIVSKVLIEMEKLDFFRADKQISLLSDENDLKQILRQKATESRAKVHQHLENYFNSIETGYYKRLEEIIDKLYEPEVSIHDIEARFSLSRNGFAALLLENGKELSLVDLKTYRVKWNIKLDQFYSRVAISENANMVAVVSVEKGADRRDPRYSLTIISGKNGSLTGVLKNKEINGPAQFINLTIDDYGARISLWWFFDGFVHEGVHSIRNDRLESFRVDLRKDSQYQYFERVMITGDGKHMLLQNGSRFALWQNCSCESNETSMFNSCSIDFADYEVKKPASPEYLPGLEPLLDYNQELSKDKMYSFISVMLSLYSPQKTSYVVCQPSDVRSLLVQQKTRETLLKRAQSEEQKNNHIGALALYSDIIRLVGRSEDILSCRHRLIMQLDKARIASAWHEKTHDYYWQSNVFGLMMTSEKLVMQGHGILVTLNLPDLMLNSSCSFKWITTPDIVSIGVLAVAQDRLLVYSHETEKPYTNKLSYCSLISSSLSEKWAVDYEPSPGWEWPLKKIVCIGNLLFAEMRPGVLIKLAITEDFQPQEIKLGKPVSFLKAVRFDGKRCLFVAFKDKGFLLLDSDGNRLVFASAHLSSAGLLKISAVSDDLSAIVYWSDSSTLTVMNLEQKQSVDIWSKQWKTDDRWFSQEPHSITISPDGTAVAYIFDQQLFVKCAVTGKEVLKWVCERNKTVQSVIFDESSRWLFAATGINTIEQFQMFWEPAEIY